MNINLLRHKMTRILKYNDNIFSLYFILGSTFLRLLSIFIKIDNNLILINSFGGKKYDDSPKVLYELIKGDPRFCSCKLIWAFHKPEQFSSAVAKTVKVGTLSFFITALRARLWITNSSLECGLSFKRKRTFLLNTWHGTPIKKMGLDIESEKRMMKAKSNSKCNIDLMSAQSTHEADIFSRAFELAQENLLVCGLPRNDELAHCVETVKNNLKKKLGIQGKQVILYAPTFREYEIDSKLNCVISPPIQFKNWNKQLGQNIVILFRAHYEVSKALGIDFDSNEFVRDVSDYHNLNELMMASDVLVSDYSSIIFDYSILERPIYLFLYDYEEYSAKRGMYFDIREKLPFADNEAGLLELISQDDKKDVINKVKAFKASNIEACGDAAKILVNKIFEIIYA